MAAESCVGRASGDTQVCETSTKGGHGVAQFHVTTSTAEMACVQLVGEVDIAVTDELVAAVRACLAEAAAVELDCAGVTFIDSSGLGSVVLLHKEANAAGKSLTLVNVTDPVHRLLRLTGLEQALNVQAPED